MKNIFKNTNIRIKIIFALATLSLISLIVIVVLVGTKTIGWNWLTGFLLGTVTVIVAYAVVFKSIDLLVKTENHFLYYFMYLIRIGIYLIPFLLAFLIPGSPFYYVGVLIGFWPVLAIAYLNGFLLKKELKKNLINNLLS